MTLISLLGYSGRGSLSRVSKALDIKALNTENKKTWLIHHGMWVLETDKPWLTWRGLEKEKILVRAQGSLFDETGVESVSGW